MSTITEQRLLDAATRINQLKLAINQYKAQLEVSKTMHDCIPVIVITIQDLSSTGDRFVLNDNELMETKRHFIRLMEMRISAAQHEIEAIVDGLNTVPVFRPHPADLADPPGRPRRAIDMAGAEERFEPK